MANKTLVLKNPGRATKKDPALVTVIPGTEQEDAWRAKGYLAEGESAPAEASND